MTAENKDKKVIALIPARAGSKRIPKKNIRLFNGMPLIEHTIIQAKECEMIDKIIISTDDEEVKSIASKYGIGVINRPHHLSGDDALMIDVAVHAIEELTKDDSKVDVLVLLQPTSPLRKKDDIYSVVKKIIDEDSDFVVSVSKTIPWWTIRNNNGTLEPLFGWENFKTNSQDLEEVYSPNGAVLAARVDALLREKTWYTKNTRMHIMHTINSIDIDEEIDFIIAEQVMKHIKNRK